MAQEYIIYTDESVQQGEYFANFYGGVLVRSKDLRYVEVRLNDAKARLNLHQEVKWQKVTATYLAKYQELVGVFFDLIREGRVKVRIMFTHRYLAPPQLDDYQREHSYHILYYQFIKHAFGLRFSDHESGTCRVRLYLDKLPDTKEKNARFKAFVVSLNQWAEFRRCRIRIAADQIAEVNSHDHVILQLLDIVLGAIQFRLNDKHLVKAPTTGRRGKKTIAKEKLYKVINKRIRELYSNFNIGITTGTHGDMRNLWHHAYRHWRLEPKNAVIDKTKGKHNS